MSKSMRKQLEQQVRHNEKKVQELTVVWTYEKAQLEKKVAKGGKKARKAAGKLAKKSAEYAYKRERALDDAAEARASLANLAELGDAVTEETMARATVIITNMEAEEEPTRITIITEEKGEVA